jgi:hypothetical protein
MKILLAVMALSYLSIGTYGAYANGCLLNGKFTCRDGGQSDDSGDHESTAPAPAAEVSAEAEGDSAEGESLGK